MVVRAHTYRGEKWSSDSNPVLLACADGQEYVVKGRHHSHGFRVMANEQIVGSLAKAIGAPVPDVRLIEVSPALIAANPDMAHIPAGVCHGSLSLWPECTPDRRWLEYYNLPANRPRFALLAILYGWAYAGDQQLIYRKHPPQLVYSVDHGHFLAGPVWSIEGLKGLPPACPYEPIAQGCTLTAAELDEARKTLETVDAETVAHAVAAPPDEWLGMDYRIAAARLLYNGCITLRPKGSPSA